MAPHLVTAVLADLAPPPCLACRRPVARALGGPSLGLCIGCRGLLAPFPRNLCPGCLADRPGRSGLCLSCQESAPFADLLALWLYRPPLTELLRRYKFGGLDYLGEELARCLAAALSSRIDPSLEAVSAVPLHWWRRLRRGYDQAEQIARPLAVLLGLPYRPLLGRRRSTRRQARLGRSARRRNPRGAFTARGGTLPGAVLLVDDVVTTGATVGEATVALAAAGVRRICVLCVARTLPLEHRESERNRKS